MRQQGAGAQGADAFGRGGAGVGARRIVGKQRHVGVERGALRG